MSASAPPDGEDQASSFSSQPADLTSQTIATHNGAGAARYPAASAASSMRTSPAPHMCTSADVLTSIATTAQTAAADCDGVTGAADACIDDGAVVEHLRANFMHTEREPPTMSESTQATMEILCALLVQRARDAAASSPKTPKMPLRLHLSIDEQLASFRHQRMLQLCSVETPSPACMHGVR